MKLLMKRKVSVTLLIAVSLIALFFLFLSRPVILHGTEDQLPLVVTQGKLERYDDGEPSGTLVKWMSMHSRAGVEGAAIKMERDQRRIYIERYLILYPFLSTRFLHGASNVWIPSASLSGQKFDIYMRDKSGQFVKVGTAR
jgi:hypothetical protein